MKTKKKRNRDSKDRTAQELSSSQSFFFKFKANHKTPKTECDMKLFLKMGLVLKMGPKLYTLRGMQEWKRKTNEVQRVLGTAVASHTMLNICIYIFLYNAFSMLLQ